MGRKLKGLYSPDAARVKSTVLRLYFRSEIMGKSGVREGVMRDRRAAVLQVVYRIVHRIQAGEHRAGGRFAEVR